MKKYLAIFLLILLPLQFSWATVAGYCQHESNVTAKHPGHHTHDHRSADLQQSDNNASELIKAHHDCASCHLGCAAAVTSALSSPIAAAAHERQLTYRVSPSRAFAERPERPQWPMLA